MAATPVTVIDLIKRSMYLIQAVAAGEPLEAQQITDAISTLNEMIDSWSTETLSIYGESNDDFVLTPGKATYTCGPGGDFDIVRPIWVQGATCIRQGVSTPIRIITQGEYDTIPIKSTAQPLVERMLVVQEFPLARYTVHPIPTQAVTLSLSSARVLTQLSTPEEVILLPPGYLRAIRYCLALELWSEYPNPMTDIGNVRSIAIKAKSNIQVANMTDTLMSFSDVPNVEMGRSWDWRAG